MHPRDAEGFRWDETNEAKLWNHGVEAWEVEEVFLNGPVWARNKKGRAGDYLMVGRTNGGRWLTVVLEVKEATREVRAITGWPSSGGELAKYGRR